MDFKIIKKDTVTSTNTLLKEMARQGAQDGTVLAAYEQTAGRGRMGRIFYSPVTGLYFSILLRENNADPALLTTLAAVCVMKGIHETYGISTQVKWVNDLIYNGKKVCGILTESSFENGKLDYAVIGIGINISTPDFPQDIENVAGSLNADIGLRDALLENILKYFGEELPQINSRKFLDYYRERCITTGKNVTVRPFGAPAYEAFAIGIDNDAALKIKLPDGTEKTVSSGEVTLHL